MSFPLSLGDILAITSLVCTIVKELRDSTSSKSEFRDLIADLEALSSTLGLVQSIFTSQPQPKKELRDAIIVQVSLCRAVISKFLDGIEPYVKAFGSRRLRRLLGQIGWKVFKSEEITELRARLTGHRTAITMLLALLNCVKDDSPRSIGYTHENGVKLVDALGKTVVLPMEMCFTKSQFDATLRAMFMDRAGQQYVERGDFEISCQEGRQMIDARSWERIVKIGVTLEMNMIVRRITYEDPKNDCPRCGRQNSSITPNEGWIDCRYCDGRFQLTSSADRKERKNREQTSRNDEVQLFRKIHLIMLTLDDREKNIIELLEILERNRNRAANIYQQSNGFNQTTFSIVEVDE